MQTLGAELVFDIVIDDGLHVFRAGKTLFENVIDRLAGDGVYVIEDVGAPDLYLYDEYFGGLTDKYYVRYICLHRPRRPFSDNTLVMITKK